jgi:hypothetical protein
MIVSPETKRRNRVIEKNRIYEKETDKVERKIDLRKRKRNKMCEK